MDIVDNVDNLGTKKIGATEENVQLSGIVEFLKIITAKLCKPSYPQKNPHVKYTLMCIIMWIMWITILQAGFPLFLQRLRRP